MLKVSIIGYLTQVWGTSHTTFCVDLLLNYMLNDVKFIRNLTYISYAITQSNPVVEII